MSEWLIHLLYFPRHRNSGSPFRRSWIGESLHPSTYLSSFCSNNLLLRKLYSATTLIQTHYHIEWWFPILRDHYRQCLDKIQLLCYYPRLVPSFLDIVELSNFL